MNTVDLCQEIDKLLDADFFETSYGKHFALKHLSDELVKDFITDAQVEAFIRFNEMKERSPKVFFHGHRVNLTNDKGHDKAQFDHIMRLHSGGASLICNQTQKVSSNISFLTNFLEQKFEGKAHGNLYVTPSKMTAFNPHYDRHDVIVIQLRGSKKWSFYAPHHSKVEKHSFSKDDLEKTDEVVLKTGSVLYVPHGLIHVAESTDETSWHITLGIKGYYWKDALKDIIDQAANPHHLNLLRRLPIKSGTATQLQDEAKALFDMMKSQVDLSHGLAKFKEAYPDLASPNLAEPTQGFAAPDSIDDNQLFSFINPSELIVETSEERLSLSHPDRKSQLYLKLSLLGLISRMRKTSEFSPASVGGEETIRDVKLFFSFLMENGFIKTLAT